MKSFFRMTAFGIIAFVVVMIGISVEGAAQGEDLVTDRPDQTESATVVVPGKVQIEAGVFIEFDTLVAGVQQDVVRLGLPSVLVRIGVLENLEARVGADLMQTSYKVPSIFPGGGDDRITFHDRGLSLGAKLSFHDDPESETTSAVLGTVRLPLSGENDLLSAELRASLGLSVGSATSLGLNIGTEWVDGDGFSGLYTLAAGLSVSDALGIFVEVYGGAFWEEDAPQAFDTGLTFKTSDNFQLDLAAGFGLNKAASDVYAGLGFSWRIPR